MDIFSKQDLNSRFVRIAFDPVAKDFFFFFFFFFVCVCVCGRGVPFEVVFQFVCIEFVSA